VSGRALRQFYGADAPAFAIDGLPAPATVFRGHRARFLGALAQLSDDEWAARTRCDAWDAKDVCNHLVTADGFWALSLGGRHNDAPSTFLRGFDPTTGPEAIVAPMREQSHRAVLDALRASTSQLTDALGEVGDDEWTLTSESPLGHVPLSAVAAHALWDSWLHERDVLVPRGRTATSADADELATAAAFTLFFAGVEGDDGDVDVAVAFDDVPGVAFRLCVVDRAVHVAVDKGGARSAGTAVAFVETAAGRGDRSAFPPALASRLSTAREVL
jgi:uncharacterized protein (TIGR03083 family)